MTSTLAVSELSRQTPELCRSAPLRGAPARSLSGLGRLSLVGSQVRACFDSRAVRRCLLTTGDKTSGRRHGPVGGPLGDEHEGAAYGRALIGSSLRSRGDLAGTKAVAAHQDAWTPCTGWKTPGGANGPRWPRGGAVIRQFAPSLRARARRAPCPETMETRRSQKVAGGQPALSTQPATATTPNRAG